MGDKSIALNIITVYHKNKCAREMVDSINRDLMEKIIGLQFEKIEMSKSQITLWIDCQTLPEYITELYKLDGVLEIGIKKPDSSSSVSKEIPSAPQVDSKEVVKRLIGNWKAVSIASLSKQVSPSILAEFRLSFNEIRVTICDCTTSVNYFYSLWTSESSGSIDLKCGHEWIERAKLWVSDSQREEGLLLNAYYNRKFCRPRTVEFRLDKSGSKLTLCFEGDACEFTRV